MSKQRKLKRWLSMGLLLTLMILNIYYITLIPDATKEIQQLKEPRFQYVNGSFQETKYKQPKILEKANMIEFIDMMAFGCLLLLLGIKVYEGRLK